MFGHFKCNYTFGSLEAVALSDNDVCFHIPLAILLDVLGGAEDAGKSRTLAVCERERARIEAACRKARARAPKDTTITLTRGDFAATDSERLVLVFPDSKTAQQFGGWVFSEGYPARVISQNIVSLYVLVQDRKRIVQEAGDRNGQVGR